MFYYVVFIFQSHSICFIITPSIPQLTRKKQGLFVVAAQVVASHWHQIRRLVLTNANFFGAQSENVTCENPGYVSPNRTSCEISRVTSKRQQRKAIRIWSFWIANGANLSLSMSLISALSISKTISLPCLETTTASAYFSCSKAGRWEHIGHIQLNTSRLHQ